MTLLILCYSGRGSVGFPEREPYLGVVLGEGSQLYIVQED